MLQLADGTLILETAAIARYLDRTYPGRKIMGKDALGQGLDTMWDSRIETAFHVLHTGLGFKLELTAKVSNKKTAEARARAIFAAIAGAQLLARSRSDISLFDTLIETYRASGPSAGLSRGPPRTRRRSP